jgi:phosphoribosylanthranilate isomerase
MVTRVKICGITREQDARLAIELGAHALGFIFEPTSPRYLGQVPNWIRDLPPYVSRVAVFGQAPASFTESMFHALQGDASSFGAAQEDRFQRIAAVRCAANKSVRDVLAEADPTDAVLLDAFVEGAYGGTGKKIDWDFAAEVVRISTKPVILAGGLTAENVAEAIQRVRPYAVDVCSGVEAEPGIKDHAKLREFVAGALGGGYGG